MQSIETLAATTNQTALVRVDLNVPFNDQAQVADTTRIQKVLPTITMLADKGYKVALLAHLGRPKGQPNADYSLQPVYESLKTLLPNYTVAFAKDCVGDQAANAINSLDAGEIVLLENVRFHAGEESNDASFAQQLADLGDIYVNDAFSAAHRAHASTEKLAHLLPAYAGLLMAAELNALQQALGAPQRPVMAIVGGAKVSTKIALLENLVSKVDYLAIGGGMANTFLAALGHPVGRSLCEHDLVDTAKKILAAADQQNCRILLPQDVVIAGAFSADVPSQTVTLAAVPDDQMILDIGAATAQNWQEIISQCKTVVWNGPVGAFEMQPYAGGTMALAETIANQTRDNGLVSIAGGGDTIAALIAAQQFDNLSYVSTAGGAFLEWMEGKTLPGVAALETGLKSAA